MKKRFNIATVVGLVLLAAALSFMFTYFAVERQFESILQTEQSEAKKLQKVSRVLSIIENEFVGDYDYDTLLDGAAAGIIAATGDRWSFYMTDEDYKSYMQSSQNAYVGIGTTVVYDAENGGILITRVHDNSPALAAGLQPRDLIVSVNGTKVSEVGYSAAVDMVRGEEGTSVTLGVISAGQTGERDIAVERKSYQYNPVSSEIIEGNIGYMRIDNFDEHAADYFGDALDKLLAANVEGLIFDVRNNGGGHKSEMVEMLDRLCPEGPLFIMRDKAGQESVDYSDASEVDLPMVVIVNQDSYSAAEFFAAALREYGKALIVGVETSGKGYAQQTRLLGDGSAMNISVNEYFTPNGNSLVGTGVSLDLEVEQQSDKNLYLLERNEDTQFTAALDLLKQQMAGGFNTEG